MSVSCLGDRLVYCTVDREEKQKTQRTVVKELKASAVTKRAKLD